MRARRLQFTSRAKLDTREYSKTSTFLFGLPHLVYSVYPYSHTATLEGGAPKIDTHEMGKLKERGRAAK